MSKFECLANFAERSLGKWLTIDRRVILVHRCAATAWGKALADLKIRSIQSSVVFVGGGGFKPSLLDFSEFFDGQQDSDVALHELGGFAQVFYSSKRYEISMAPDRLDLKCHNENAVGIVEPLIRTAHQVCNVLQPLNAVLSVTALGLNNDFQVESPAKTGLDLFSELVNVEALRQLVPFKQLSPSNSLRVVGIVEQMRIAVTFEPHVQSEGDHLYVRVNGHVLIQPGTTLLDAVRNVENYNDNWKGLVSHLLRKMDGGNQS